MSAEVHRDSLSRDHPLKRVRAGSISGRLRTASDLEQWGWIDKAQKGVIKDLIISGDPKVQSALDKFDRGETGELEALFQQGAFRTQSIDILEGLDLDFLTVGNDEFSFDQQFEESIVSSSGNAAQGAASGVEGVLENVKVEGEREGGTGVLNRDWFLRRLSIGNDSSATFGGTSFRKDEVGADPLEWRHDIQQQQVWGMGDGKFVDGEVDLSAYRSLAATLQANGSSPVPRMIKTGGTKRPMSKAPAMRGVHTVLGAGAVPGNQNTSAQSHKAGGAGPSSSSSGRFVIDGPHVKRDLGAHAHTQRPREATESASAFSDLTFRGSSFDLLDGDLLDETLPPVSSSRMHSAEHMKVAHLSSALPGFVGAYSPQSRRERVERFLEKRNRRVWTKKVKYDVRKNFADSRLRVKGRFVKKEDEELMRELLSI